MRLVFLVLFELLISTISPSQVKGNYPISPGNFWVYRNGGLYSLPPFTMLVLDSTVTKDTLKYYIIKYQTNITTYRLIRFDSISNFAVNRLDPNYPAPNNELKYFKLDGVIGDSWVVPDPAVPQQNLYVEIFDVLTGYAFGEWIDVYQYWIHDSIYIYNYGEFWSEKFGMLSDADDMGQPVDVLTGCVIDGIVYGDTSTVVGIEDMDEQIEDFYLLQNYPNPFNPTTNITYQVPELSFVSLKVYNVLGKEVATLVNEQKYRGKYSVKFVASNLASGIYLYQFRVNDFVSSKKMIFLK